MSQLLSEPEVVTPVDFRRPSRIGRDAVLALESAHEVFARRLATTWASLAHTVVDVEHVATDQLSVDDYVSTLPTPTVLASLRVSALGATALLDLDAPLTLLLVERLLGGPGDPAQADVARRPTDLETSLIGSELLLPAAQAIDEAMPDPAKETSELLGIETAPQPLQMNSSGELLLLTYRVELRGELPAQGLLTLAYPVIPLVAQLDRMAAGGTDDDEDVRAAQQAMTNALLGSSLDVRVRLGGSPLDTAALAALTPGDVLRLDHSVSQPASLVCGDRTIGTVHLGRRGRRLAVQIITPPAATRS